jgi:hypothetical protein
MSPITYPADIIVNQRIDHCKCCDRILTTGIVKKSLKTGKATTRWQAPRLFESIDRQKNRGFSDDLSGRKKPRRVTPKKCYEVIAGWGS